MPSQSPVSTGNPLKRARLDDSSNAGSPDQPVAPTPAELRALVQKLTRDELEVVLLDAASSNERILSAIRRASEARQAIERAQVHDFDHYSKSAWYSINKKYDRHSGAQQFDAGFEVAAEIEEMFKTMADQTHAHSPLATKRSALETMRKILKSICLHRSEVGKVVKTNIHGHMGHMIAVATRFSAADVKSIKAEGLIDRLEELEDLCGDYAVFEELSDVLDIVSPHPWHWLTAA